MKTRRSRSQLALATAATLLVGKLGVGGFSPSHASAQQAQPEAAPDPYAALPASLSLTAVVRDFRERSVTDGHTDFERQPTAGFGHFVSIVADTLSEDLAPVFRSSGYRCTRQATDLAGNPLLVKSYILARDGDTAATISAAQGGAVVDANSFNQWFRDVQGVNMSETIELSLNRLPNTNVYSFNSATDSPYNSLGGFFPINGRMFGNSRNENKNFHFTLELDTTFIYRRGRGTIFKFTGDDDVWVFIDNKLVIDLGGVHGAIAQTVELDRLTWLQDGQTYSLKFFFAERHRSQSNFRIETTLNLQDTEAAADVAGAGPGGRRKPQVREWKQVAPR